MNMTPTTNNATLTLKVDAESTNRGWPTLRVTLQNDTAAPIEICTYMLRHRLLWSISAKGPDGDLLFVSFDPTEFAHTATAAFETLRPGEAHVEVLALESKGWHFVRANHQPPVLEANDAIARPKSGAYTFAVSFTPWAVVYRGESGKHDRRIAMARVPDDLGITDRDVSRVFRGEITGRSTATLL
jgi:hypothetical protein